MKKVSIVVPVYNVEKYLKKCLDSLVNQTLEDIEIILINDGSKDNSLKILKEYEKKYPNKIILIDQENQGISVARNNGIKKATGKYLGFVDSDDFVDEKMFEELYKKIEKEKGDIVICNYKKYMTYDESTYNIDVIKNIDLENIYDNPSIINLIDYAPWNKLYKKSLFEDILFPPNKKYEDINAILKIFLKAKKISKLEDYLYYYRINFDGETLSVNKKVNDILFILDDLLKYTKENKNYNKLEQEFEKLCVDKLFYYLILSYQLNDKNYIKEFRNNIISFLNNNFKNWKKYYINKSNFSLKSKIIICNNILFNIFISKKFK